MTLTDAYSYEAHASDASVQSALASLSPSVASELTRRAGMQRGARGDNYQQAALPRPGAAYGAAEVRDTWTLGDLLARASREDESHHGSPTSPPALPFQHNIAVIARALDPATTSAIWARIMAGQRGVMVRSIYTPEGRAAFDELSLRYQSDTDLQRTVERYLLDFERIRRESEMSDPTGRMAHSHLVSDMGRVYLFLAHLSGRLS